MPSLDPEEVEAVIEYCRTHPAEVASYLARVEARAAERYRLSRPDPPPVARRLRAFAEWRSDPGFRRYLEPQAITERPLEWLATRAPFWSGEWEYETHDESLALIPRQPTECVERVLAIAHLGDISFGRAAGILGVDRYVFDLLYRRWRSGQRPDRLQQVLDTGWELT